MMKTYLKNEKGITMTVLIVTIIVMVILAAVSLQAIIPEEGEILEQTEEVKENFELQQIIGQIHNALDYKYYLNSGKSLTDDGNEEIIETLSKIIVETEISANKFVIYYDKKNSTNLIFYRGDLVTDEERSKLDSHVNVEGEFEVDANSDGVLSKEDIKIIEDEGKKEIIKEIINGEESILNYNK